MYYSDTGQDVINKPAINKSAGFNEMQAVLPAKCSAQSKMTSYRNMREQPFKLSTQSLSDPHMSA
jgi:hypothetical protein